MICPAILAAKAVAGLVPHIAANAPVRKSALVERSISSGSWSVELVAAS